MVVCWWVLKRVGGAVHRHHRPHKWVGRGAAHHAHHHAAGGAKLVKILVCTATGLGIGGASSWEGASSTVGAALPPPAAYSEIPGLESGWFGPSGPAIVAGGGDIFSTPPTAATFEVSARSTLSPELAAILVPHFPGPEIQAMGGPSVAHGTVVEKPLGTFERNVSVMLSSNAVTSGAGSAYQAVPEPMSTIRLLLTAMASLLFLRIAMWYRK